MLKRILKNFIVNGAMYAVRIFVSLAVTRVVVHSLGIEEYGVWVFVLSFSISGYLSLFTLGIQGAFVKIVAEHQALGRTADVNKAFTATLISYSIVGVLAAACLAVFSRFLLGHFFHIPGPYLSVASTLLYVFSIQALIDFPSLALSGLIDGIQRYDLNSICEAGRVLVFAAITVVLLHFGRGVLSMGVALCALSLGNALVLIMIIRRQLPSLALVTNIRWSDISEMTRLAGKLFGIRINAILYGQMDKAVLASLLTTTALSHYDIASRFHSLVLIAMGMVSSVILSSSAELHARDERVQLRKLFLAGTKYSAAITVPITLTLIVLARPLLNVWMGAAFVDDDRLVTLFLSYTLFWVLVQVGWNILIAMDHAGEILKVQVATTAINLAVSVLMTELRGVEGVLWGTLIGNGVACILFIRMFGRKLSVTIGEFVRNVILPVYPASISIAAVVFVVSRVLQPTSLVGLAVCGGIGVFGSLLFFIFVGITGDEKTQLLKIVRGWMRGAVKT